MRTWTCRQVAVRLTIALSWAGQGWAGEEPASPGEPSLDQQIAEADRAVFDAFNHCSDPAALKRHADFFDENVEFYHDTGGVTWNRPQMLANTRRNVCGHYTRELIPGSLRVYPVKGFGAISMGSHRFCALPAGPCEGLADFTMVWRHVGTTWKITRVLSYGHRANSAEVSARGP